MVIESIPKIVGMVYAVIVTILAIVLSRRGKLNKKVGYVFLAISTLFGFLVFAPMLPHQFEAVILGNVGQLGAPITVAVVVLIVFVVLAFVFGRAFCGYVCPIGTLQELLYNIPTKKLRIRDNWILVVVHYVFFVAFIVVALTLSIGLLQYLGVRDFFYLNIVSGFFYVFLALLIVSVFFYRPFCRLACPYGVLLSVAAIKSLFKLRRNEACIDCKKCGEECPTYEEGRADLKRECYLCRRCVYACPNDALDYTRRQDIQLKKETVDLDAVD
jgi:polyferredoxin